MTDDVGPAVLALDALMTDPGWRDTVARARELMPPWMRDQLDAAAGQSHQMMEKIAQRLPDAGLRDTEPSTYPQLGTPRIARLADHLGCRPELDVHARPRHGPPDAGAHRGVETAPGDVSRLRTPVPVPAQLGVGPNLRRLRHGGGRRDGDLDRRGGRGRTHLPVRGVRGLPILGRLIVWYDVDSSDSSDLEKRSP